MFGHFSRRRFFGFAASGGAAILLPGCTTTDRGPTVPVGEAPRATVLGIPNERFFPLMGLAPLEAEFNAAVVRLHRTFGIPPTGAMPKLHLLAISGGGEDGAFGAGLLCGWTEHRGRPIFELVTGVSAGSLIAPFAYLGSEYDPQLRAIYTQLTPDKVLTKRGFTAALFDDALADNQPLFKTISSYMTEDVMAAIAAAYSQGRLLLVGTTDLDAQQPVMWNIGAIAQSGNPRALDTIRRILLASAAMPGIFPPSMIDVTLDGKHYQEMHVDGGALAQAFLYPASLMTRREERISRGEPVISLEAYVIRNGRLDPQWSDVERRTLPIAARAISTMTTASGFNDVLRIYNDTKRDGIGFNLAYIDTDFTEKLPQPFDPGYMRALFDYGFQHGRNGYHWVQRPPFLS